MSWDLHVYAAVRPALGSAAECAREGGLHVDGEGDDVHITLPGADEDFFVSEPLTFEPEDAPDAVLDADVESGWLMERAAKESEAAAELLFSQLDLQREPARVIPKL